MKRLLGAVAACAFAARSHAIERYTTPNGVTVILAPTGAGESVGIEAMYPVGFAHEPEGMPQAAHLVEHLACNSASASFERGGSMRELNALGLANAETMAHFTHYDMVVPREKLELAITIEAERLASLRFDAEDVAIEGPRCAAELVSVESHPTRPVHKFATMAASQSWRYGARRVLLKSLETAPADRLAAFHRAHYVPGNLTLTIVGGFEPAEARRVIEARLGTLPRGERPPAPRAIDWDVIERASDVEWDGAAGVVVLAWAAPEEPASRLALAAWADLFTYAIVNDGSVSRVTPMLLADGRGALTGVMPFTITAPLADGVEPEAAIAAIDSALASALEMGIEIGAVASLRPLFFQIVEPPFDAAALGAQADAFAGRSGMSRERAQMMVVGTAALQLGMAEIHSRGRGEPLRRAASAMKPEEITALLRTTLTPERRVIRILRPIP